MATIAGKFFKAIGLAVKNAPKAAVDLFKSQGKAAGQLLSGNPSGVWDIAKGFVGGIKEQAQSASQKAAANLGAEKFLKPYTSNGTYLTNEKESSPVVSLLTWKNVAIVVGVIIVAWLLFTKVLKRR